MPKDEPVWFDHSKPAGWLDYHDALREYDRLRNCKVRNTNTGEQTDDTEETPTELP